MGANLPGQAGKYGRWVHRVPPTSFPEYVQEIVPSLEWDYHSCNILQLEATRAPFVARKIQNDLQS